MTRKDLILGVITIFIGLIVMYFYLKGESFVSAIIFLCFAIFNLVLRKPFSLLILMIAFLLIAYAAQKQVLTIILSSILAFVGWFDSRHFKKIKRSVDQKNVGREKLREMYAQEEIFQKLWNIIITKLKSLK